MPDDATESPVPPASRRLGARERRTFAALAGLTSLSILLQGIFAGVFIEPGAHAGWLNAHEVNADIATALGVLTAVYAVVLGQRIGRPIVTGSVLLALLLVAQTAIGHAITGSGDNGLTAVHVPLALLAFGLTIWLSARARTIRAAPS
jgi:hypothetical protein